MIKIAIVKPIKVRVGNLAGLRGVLNYIKADFKTKAGTLVFGKDCIPEKAFEQMLITKKAFHKEIGRQYAHFVQSFHRDDPLTPEQAMEIGQKFLERYERFKDFQVCAAVHTNGPQLHIHYVINTVSHIDGHKWQSSLEDLKHMRCISDELCREHGLMVYEKQNSGHRSYGEHTARNSWKKQLAEDVARCAKMSSNRADFEALLWRCGISCDVGDKSILFTISSGVYGLKEERKCSNWKLMSYGDFSSENILSTMDFNTYVLSEAWSDFSMVSHVLAEFGAMNSPDNPNQYEEAFLQRMNPADLEGKSRLEIEQILAERKFRELVAKQNKALQEKIAAEQAQSAMLTHSLAGLFEEFEKWQWERKYQQNMFRQEQQKTGETKEAEIYEEEMELY